MKLSQARTLGISHYVRIHCDQQRRWIQGHIQRFREFIPALPISRAIMSPILTSDCEDGLAGECIVLLGIWGGVFDGSGSFWGGDQWRGENYFECWDEEDYWIYKTAKAYSFWMLDTMGQRLPPSLLRLIQQLAKYLESPTKHGLPLMAPYHIFDQPAKRSHGSSTREENH